MLSVQLRMSTSNQPSIFKLPSPVFFSIAVNFLGISDIALNLARICKKFREIARQEHFWKLACLASFGAPEQAPVSWLTHAKLYVRSSGLFLNWFALQTASNGRSV